MRFSCGWVRDHRVNQYGPFVTRSDCDPNCFTKTKFPTYKNSIPIFAIFVQRELHRTPRTIGSCKCLRKWRVEHLKVCLHSKRLHVVKLLHGRGYRYEWGERRVKSDWECEWSLTVVFGHLKVIWYDFSGNIYQNVSYTLTKYDSLKFHEVNNCRSVFTCKRKIMNEIMNTYK